MTALTHWSHPAAASAAAATAAAAEAIWSCLNKFIYKAADAATAEAAAGTVKSHKKALHDRRSVQLGVAYGYNISEVTERLFMNGQQNSPPAAAAVGITAAGLWRNVTRGEYTFQHWYL